MTAVPPASLNASAVSAVPETSTAAVKLKRIPRRGGRWYVRRVLRCEMARVAEQHLFGADDLLVDYGCGDTPYRELLAPRVKRYLGLDLGEGERVDAQLRDDFTADLPDASADIVVSTQVLEHVPEPQAYLAECRRLLAADGKLILSTHGHWRFHPHPDDYWRWTSQGLRRLLGDAGFDVADWRGLIGLGAVGTLMLQDAVVRKLPRFLRSSTASGFQWACAAADRFQDGKARQLDAAVYLVVATPRCRPAPEPGGTSS